MYRKIAVPITALLFVLVGSLFTIPVFAQGNSTTTDSTTIEIDDENCADLFFGRPVATPKYLHIVYERGGGFAPALSYERISYDSLTGQVVTSPSAIGGIEIDFVSRNEQICLEEEVAGSGFFEAQNDYPPIEGPTDFFTYSLAINLNNRTYTVTWTDFSEGVPPGIFEIVKEIKAFAAR